MVAPRAADSRAVPVDPGNAGQLAAWDGAQGAFWATEADRFDRAVARYDTAFLAAADLRPGNRVLDVGCGTGRTTREAARRTGSAVGVDLSSAMLEVARRRAADEGLTGVRFEEADAQWRPSPRPPSTWRSAGPARCSSPTR